MKFSSHLHSIPSEEWKETHLHRKKTTAIPELDQLSNNIFKKKKKNPEYIFLCNPISLS